MITHLEVGYESSISEKKISKEITPETGNPEKPAVGYSPFPGDLPRAIIGKK